jgi:hypothetical protein
VVEEPTHSSSTVSPTAPSATLTEVTWEARGGHCLLAQSNLPCWSRVPRKVSQMCSHTPWSCHYWRRRWQVDRLPYSLGRSFQRAPKRDTQRMPLRVLRSSARGRPRFLWLGSSGAVKSHWPSRRSPSITQASQHETRDEV